MCSIHAEVRLKNIYHYFLCRLSPQLSQPQWPPPKVVTPLPLVYTIMLRPLSSTMPLLLPTTMSLLLPITMSQPISTTKSQLVPTPLLPPQSITQATIQHTTLPTNLPKSLLTSLLTPLPTHLLTHLPTHLLTPLPTHLLTPLATPHSIDVVRERFGRVMAPVLDP